MALAFPKLHLLTRFPHWLKGDESFILLLLNFPKFGDLNLVGNDFFEVLTETIKTSVVRLYKPKAVLRAVCCFDENFKIAAFVSKEKRYCYRQRLCSAVH